MIRAGELTHRGHVMRPETTNVAGRPKHTWQRTGDPIEFGFVSQATREFEHASRINSGLTQILRARFRTDIKPKYRIEDDDGTIHNIIGVENVMGRDIELLIKCGEDTTSA